MEEIQNGVIIRPVEERDERDFVRGISSTIVPVINNASRDWSAYLPSFVPQKYKFDCNNCTGFSFVHTFETQMNWLKVAGKLAGDTLKWFQDSGYIDGNGSFAISERFAGIMAGTTVNGNSPFLVWKAAAKYGILPRKDLSYSLDQSASFGSQATMCADYYRKSAVTQAMAQKAQKALSLLVIQYEWIGGEFNAQTPSAGIAEALEQAPLQIAVPVCLPGWNSQEIPLCGVHQANHAVTLFKEVNGDMTIFDQYQPNPKGFALGYYVPQAILGVIAPVPPSPDIGGGNEAPTQADVSAWTRILKWAAEKLSSILSPSTETGRPSIWDDIIEQ